MQRVYRIVKYFDDKKVWQNNVFETLAKKIWQIQGLPVFLALNVVNYENSACASSIASTQDNSVLIQHKTFIECEMRSFLLYSIFCWLVAIILHGKERI